MNQKSKKDKFIEIKWLMGPMYEAQIFAGNYYLSMVGKSLYINKVCEILFKTNDLIKDVK